METYSQVATFLIKDEIYGISIGDIKEIVRYPEITEVPKAPKYLKGLTNLRGNVMPVIDARIKLDVEAQEESDNTRVIVLDTGATPTGIIVDKVKGVQNIEGASIEDTPAVLSVNVEKRFISKIIKLDKNIIMQLDISQLCDIDVSKISESKESMSAAASEDEQADSKTIEDVQLVSFIIGNEEYAFYIDKVREILRFDKITEVPNSPEYMLGLITVRGKLLPVVDLRKLFNMRTFGEDISEHVEKIKAAHEEFLKALSSSIDGKSVFKGELDHNKCSFGVFLSNFYTSSVEVDNAVEEIKQDHVLFHNYAKESLDILRESGSEKAKSFFDEKILPTGKLVINHFERLQKTIEQNINQDQKILVIEFGNISIGLAVDKMKHVIRLPKDVVAEPPSLLSGKRGKDLRGIANLENGSRLVMLLNEENLLSVQNLEDIKSMNKAEEKKEEERVLTAEEVKFVTFKLSNEYFAIGIDFVQEINRVSEITEVPKTSDFIVGVMNLRNNVIPMINLRAKFEMHKIDYDDSTRVIIVNLKGKLTGFIVDKVSEVLSTSVSNILPPPDVLVNDINTDFISGICKLSDKMLLVVDINKVLTQKEHDELLDIDERKKA